MPPNTVGARLPLAALVAANAVSLLGNTLAAVAIPWFVLVSTGSAAKTGIAAFFTTLPLALGAFLGGTLVDRLGPRRASVLGDLMSAAAIGAIPLLHAAGELEFWHVVVLAFAGALFDAPSQSAREAILPDLAGRGGVPLERATSLWTSAEHTGYVLGAPLAGVLIAAIGAPNVLWLDGASFVASALAVRALVPAAQPVPRARERYLREVLDALRFIRRNRTILTFLVVAALGNLLVSPLGPVLLPLYAREVFGSAATLGLMIGAYGVGGLAGTALVGVAGARTPRRGVYTSAWLAYALLYLLLVALPPLAAAVVLLFLIGAAAGAVAPLEQAVRQERTPGELRGRVFSTQMAVMTVAAPPGVLAAGLLAEWVGLRGALAAFAAANAVLAVAVVLTSAVRRL